MPVTITFWGVRGSIPTPARDNLGFGGNTACIELRSGSEVLILDAGTGIRDCGNRILSQNGPHNIAVLLSHFHWDHLHGLPYFDPLFRPEFRLRFMASVREEAIRDYLRGTMKHPYFPVDWEQSASQKEYVSLPPSGISSGPFHIESIPLNHPQGATGYRILTPAGLFVYAADFEHGDRTCDEVLLESIKGAKVLVYDAQYTPEEYDAGRRGWGHSTWREAAKFAQEGSVDRLVLFHHHPNHTDAMMTEIQLKARESFSNTDVAIERSSICIG